jgi:23S rRNA pseudouridine1911/1915/1917 synthase
MEQRFTIRFEASKDQQLLREALAEYGISKRALTAIKFDGGEILVNQTEQNVRYPLSVGDQIEVKFPVEIVSDGLIAEFHEQMPVVYEDEAILIIHKPPFMSTIPSREHPTGSVANFVRGYYEQQGIHSTLHIVTRLDRDTSGIMVIAKHRHIHHLMSEMQKRGEIHRTYEAIVHGHVENDFQQIIAPIGRTDRSIIEREIREDGQFAHTDLTVLSRFEKAGQPMTRIQLKLHTGRTHQIRVHAAHIGHPLVGDDLYGGLRAHIDRQALHCVSVAFVHPITQEQVAIRIPMSDDIEKLYM